METTKKLILGSAIALIVGASAIYADQPRMTQRAAANHFELPSTSAPRNTSLPDVKVDLGLRGGKHWAQIQESRKAVSSKPGIDLAHAPRPITASKDPDLERKWRENAQRQFDLAPVK